MKNMLRSAVLVALGAIMLYGIGTSLAGSDAPPPGGKPCPGCPQAAAGKSGPAPMPEKMKAHLDGMKSAVAALRDSEKSLASAEDPKAFRAAVIGHLKKLDDLQASHLEHMESMAGRMHGGAGGADHGKCRDCRCGECKCKDCTNGNDCCCKEGGAKAGGQGH